METFFIQTLWSDNRIHTEYEFEGTEGEAIKEAQGLCDSPLTETDSVRVLDLDGSLIFFSKISNR